MSIRKNSATNFYGFYLARAYGAQAASIIDSLILAVCKSLKFKVWARIIRFFRPGAPETQKRFGVKTIILLRECKRPLLRRLCLDFDKKKENDTVLLIMVFSMFNIYVYFYVKNLKNSSVIVCSVTCVFLYHLRKYLTKPKIQLCMV